MSTEKLIAVAVGLMLASLGLGFVNTVMGWQDSVEQFGSSTVLLVVFVPVSLYLLLLYLVIKRFNWARIVILVLIFMALPGYAMSMFADVSIQAKVVQILQAVLNVGGAVLLLHSRSAAWFKKTE